MISTLAFLVFAVIQQTLVSRVKEVASNEIIVEINGVGHIRVQALSDTLVRFELAKSDGSFEDRQTFLVQNRSVKGVPIKLEQPPGPSGAVLSTSAYTIQLRSPTWLSSLPPSSCRDPLVGYAPASATAAEIVGVVASATSAASCCGACDKMSACEAWLFDAQLPKPHAGLTLRRCDGSAGQIWSFKADGSITAMHSAAKGPGCWQIPSCNTVEGAPVIAGQGCKPVPEPGVLGCAANEAFRWIAANHTFVSDMDGKCVTRSGSGPGAKLSLHACGLHADEQAWDVNPAGAHGKDEWSVVSPSGLCLDDTPPPPNPQTTNCTLLRNVSAISSASGSLTLGGTHPGTSNHGDGCAVAITLKATGEVVWTSPAFGAASASLDAPPPSQALSTGAFALADSPRFVPPPQGAAPASRPGKFPLTSGFDVGAHATDVYVFILARGHRAFRSEFLSLTGPVPPLPAWAFGLWFCWYHTYTQAEKKAEIERFHALELGLSVAALDRGWRNETVDSDGRFEYKVNTSLFPSMSSLVAFARSEEGAHTRFFFNDHPKRLATGTKGGSGPSTPEVVLSPAEISFRYNSHAAIFNSTGIDFFWNDCHWAWMTPSLAIANASNRVDGPTWGAAVFHDVLASYSERSHTPRPLIGMGCSGSRHPASHRYPVQWTGDIFSTQLLDNVARTVAGGYRTFNSYVHPDCGGHHNHDPPEVYLRWIQFCALSNVFRIHSDPYNDRRPWNQHSDAVTNDTVVRIFRDFVQMRVKLTPTLVSAAAQMSIDGTPLVQRLDYLWPSLPGSTRMDQYMLGGANPSLLVAPVSPFRLANPNSPPFNRTRLVWVPPGEWTDSFSGKVLVGPATINRTEIPINETVLLHRHGVALVTARIAVRSVTAIDWTDLALHLWPSGAGGLSQSPGAQTTLFHDTTTRTPATWTTNITIHPGGGHDDCGTDMLASPPRRQRKVRISIGRERETSRGSGSVLHPPRTPLSRGWTVLVHLALGEQIESAVVDGVMVEPSATHSDRNRSALLTVGHGTVVRLSLERSAAARDVSLCISG